MLWIKRCKKKRHTILFRRILFARHCTKCVIVQPRRARQLPLLAARAAPALLSSGVRHRCRPFFRRLRIYAISINDRSSTFGRYNYTRVKKENLDTPKFLGKLIDGKSNGRCFILTCAAQSPPVWNGGAAGAAGGMGAVVGGATSSAQFSVATAATALGSTSFTQPGSGAGAGSTGPVNSFTAGGAISLAACSSFSAWKRKTNA